MPDPVKVLRRFMAFKYQPKESKQSKIDRLQKLIREKTGIGRAAAEDLADAVIRGRDIARLAPGKKWPVTDGTVTGPSGHMTLDEVSAEI